jgi:hydrogenase 3 maturation protease
MTKTTIWCIGNPIMKDDGAGPALYEKLTEGLPPEMAAVNCETTPENWLSPFRSDPPETLVIVDAAEMGMQAGAVRRVPLSLTGEVGFSSHGLPLSLLLAPFEGSFEIVVLGIQPKERGVGTGLSPEVLRAVESVAALIKEGHWREVPPYQENFSPR